MHLRALLGFSVLATLAAPALADDEGSEQTAQLMGAPSDTLGVTVAFEPKAGWSMRVRPAPAAAEETFALPALGTHHAHFVVYVAPARSKITFVEISHGMRARSDVLRATSPVAWTYSPRGRLLFKTTYGQLFSAAERAKFTRSISHVRWTEMPQVTNQGLAIKVADSARTVVVDARNGKLR